MLSGKKVAITGALGGIGLPLLKHLDSLGAQLLALDITDSQSAQKLLAENNLSSVAFQQLDITDEKAVSNFAATTLSNESPSSLVN